MQKKTKKREKKLLINLWLDLKRCKWVRERKTAKSFKFNVMFQLIWDAESDFQVSSTVHVKKNYFYFLSRKLIYHHFFRCQVLFCLFFLLFHKWGDKSAEETVLKKKFLNFFDFKILIPSHRERLFLVLFFRAPFAFWGRKEKNLWQKYTIFAQKMRKLYIHIYVF